MVFLCLILEDSLLNARSLEWLTITCCDGFKDVDMYMMRIRMKSEIVSIVKSQTVMVSTQLEK